MTDEEKKAIEIIKFLQEKCLLENGRGMMPIYRIDDLANAIETLLNLIEKQFKEIEELKMITKEYDSFLGNEKIIIADKSYFDDGYFIEKYISKDKIKAKIEEVEQWELYNMKIPKLSTLDERLGAKIGIKYVLQSLLEKE